MRWGLIILGVTVAVIAAYLAFLAWFIVRLSHEQRAHIAWELQLGPMRDLAPDILPDGTICSGAGEQLNWISPAGKVLASYSMPGLGQGVAWYAGAGGLWFVAPQLAGTQAGGGGAKLLALSERAEVVWETTLKQGAYTNWVCFSDDRVYCSLDTNYIVALDLQGNVLWSKQVALPPPVQQQSQQQVPPQPSQYPGTAPINAMGASPAGEVFYTNDKHELVVLGRDGQQRWSALLPAMNQHRPTQAPDGTLLVLDDGGTLTALSADGKQKWRYSSSGAGGLSGSSRPYYAPYGSMLGNGFYPAAGPAGTAYFCDVSNKLYAVAANGQLKWQLDIGGECIAPAVGHDGTIYVAVAGRGVIAYSPAGKRLWRCRSVKEIHSAPIIGADGRLLVETSDTLYAFDP